MTTAVASPLLASAAEIAELHTLQDVAVANDVAALFAAHGSEPDFAKTAHALLPEIIDDHAQASSLITAQWYDDLDPSSKFRAKPYVDIPREQLAKSIDWALYAPGDQPPVARMTGDSKRIVRNASRRTVTRNAAAEGIRWARFAQPTACSYCRALAIRGAGRADQKWLYHSDKAAIYRKSDGEKYHTNCDCEPIAVRGGSVWTPPDYMADWESQYKAASKTTKMRTPEDPEGKKYFQRIAAQMRANEPPTPEQVAQAAQAEAEKAEAEASAKVANGRALLFKELDDAVDYREVAKVAQQLLYDTDIDFGAEINGAVPDVDAARDVVKAVDDVLAEYPAMRLESLAIQELARESIYAQEEYWPRLKHRKVSLNRHWAEDPDMHSEAWNANVASGFHHPGTDSAAYNVIVHEMGHAMEDVGREQGVTIDDFTVMTALGDYFKATRPPVPGQSARDQELAFRAWLLAGLSGYSRQNPQGNSVALNVSEALAEGFADVFINGDDALEPSKVLTKVLTDALSGVSYWTARNGPVAQAA